jgi:competence CoiA-like predicted nuclease
MTLKYSKGPWWIAPFSIPKQQNTQIGIFGIETIPSYNPYQNRNFKKNNKKIFEQTNIFLLEQFNYKFSFCFDIKFCPKYFVRNYSNKIRHSSLFSKLFEQNSTQFTLFEIIRTKFDTVLVEKAHSLESRKNVLRRNGFERLRILNSPQALTGWREVKIGAKNFIDGSKFCAAFF